MKVFLKKNVFFLLLISCFIVLLVRDLFKDGMFMDGMIYMCVGKNLANGLSTFWHPHFSKTIMSAYHDQPPLLFGIEAVFFKLFGDSLYVDRCYNLLMFFLNAWVIIKIWKLVNEDSKSTSWLPLFIWITIPVCFWAFANSVEEITMGFFDLVSVYFILRSVTQNNSKLYLYVLFSGIALIAASLCKGMQGLFPMVGFFIYWLIFRDISFKKMFMNSLLLFGAVAIFYAIIFLNESVRRSYELYFHDRLANTFAHFDSGSGSRFHLLAELVSQLLPAAGVVLISWLIFRKYKMNFSVDGTQKKYVIFFLLVGLSGTLPLMITYEQRGFYLVTTLPYYAIAISFLLVNGYHGLHNYIIEIKKTSIFEYVVASIFVSSIIFTVWDLQRGPKRDKEMLHDVYIVGNVVGEGDIISIPASLHSEWSLFAYFNRYYYISLDDLSVDHDYYLLEKNADLSLLKDYTKVPVETLKYDLYKKSSIQ